MRRSFTNSTSLLLLAGLLTGCAAAPSAIDGANEETGLSGPLEAIPEDDKFDSTAPRGPRITDGSATEVWAVTRAWADQDTAAGRVDHFGEGSVPRLDDGNPARQRLQHEQTLGLDVGRRHREDVQRTQEVGLLGAIDLTDVIDPIVEAPRSELLLDPGQVGPIALTEVVDYQIVEERERGFSLEHRR